MLFRKKIDPRCAYCAKGTRLSDEEVACVKCGIVAAEHHCGAFRYDPLKRSRRVALWCGLIVRFRRWRLYLLYTR